MNIASARTRAATLAALLISGSTGFARGEGHATRHANAAVQNAAKQEAAALHRQQQAAIHQQQAMVHQQAQAQHAQQVQAHRAQQASVHRGTVHHNANRGNINRNTNPVNTGAMVSSLHSVVAELHQADHDYNGHRVQALHHLGQAIHTLQPQTSANSSVVNTNGNRANNLTTTGNRTGTGVAGAPAQKMPQAESDAHLHRARESLLNMQSRMAGNTNSNTNTKSQTHLLTAHTHVQRAMQELNLALNIR